MIGTELRLSTSYHPQSDGQTERLNQCLETYLRCFVHACPSKWNSWLSLAEYWYNTSHHSTIGQTPFEVLYGYMPRHFGLSFDDAMPDNSELNNELSDIARMQDLVRQHLLRAQLRMKKQSDKKCSERSFEVGD